MSRFARKVRGVRLDFGGITSLKVTYEYDRASDGWRRGQNGTTHQDENGAVIAPRNVVILVTGYVPSPADARSPEAQTVGSGPAVVYTAGHKIEGVWTRQSATEPFHLEAGGQPVLITPGRTWVELVDAQHNLADG